MVRICSTSRAAVILVCLLTLLLNGTACRSDQADTPQGDDPALDDSDASPVAGTIPGAFAVSSTGEATYHLPLLVPPGAAGMQPSLSVAYTSAAGDGFLGMGFSLSGLSAVTRCPRTVAQDGEIRGVHYDGKDALCLDGARLVQVGSTSGGVAEYRTIPDTFIKVLATPSENAENPAGTLKVFTRAGLILEYGSADDARVMGRDGVIRSWLLKRTKDRSENTIDYEYLNFTEADGHTREYLPFRIRYTGNRSVLPSRMVQFAYESKAVPARRSLFAGGLALTSSQQLTTISMFGPESALVREYRLAYKAGTGSGRTLLRSIRECAADGTCKPRTTFGWSGAKPGFERIPTPIKVPESQLAAPMMLDVTGDGLDDLVVPTVPWDAAAHSEKPTTDWTITPNRGATPLTGDKFFQASTVAYSEEHNDSLNDPILQQQPDLKVQPDYGTPIDYNQDGLTDILVHNVHETALGFSDTWGVLLATPDHVFTLQNTGIPRPKHLIHGTLRLNNHDASAHLADVNGDGIADLVQCERDESFGGADAFLWTLRLWTPAGPGFEKVPHTIKALALLHCAWPIQTVDVDADGKVDLVLPEVSQNQAVQRDDYAALSYDEASDAWAKEPIGKLGPSQEVSLFLDVNGDGLPDVVRLDGMTGQPVSILNTGDRHGARFGDEIQGVTDFIPGDLGALWGLAAVIDFNGDGRQDVLVPMKEGDGLPSWLLLSSKGDGTFALVEPAIPFDAELSEQGATIHNRLGPRITDVDGDGAPDVVLPIGDVFTIFRSTGARQDLLTSVHDGLNAHDPADPGNVPTLEVDYGTLIDTSITEGDDFDPTVEDDSPYLAKGWFAPSCAYPLRCVVGPRQVVSGYAHNNGADKLRRFRVQYRGGRYDRRGRGFLGFHSKITTDLDTHGGTIERYGDPAEMDLGTVKLYPGTGQIAEEIRWTPNPVPQDYDRVELSFRSFKRELRKTNGGATYFLMPTEISQARKQGTYLVGAQTLHAWLELTASGAALSVSGSTVKTTDYDEYGDVLAAVTTSPGVDLTTTLSDVKYNNDPDSWLIGQLANRTECSTAAGLKQCRSVARTYYATGLLKSETVDADGDDTLHLSITYGRDDFGNVTSTTADDKQGHHREVSTLYEPSGVFPSQHTNAVGHVVVPEYDAGLGILTSLADENQLKTTWKYDGFGRRLGETRPDGTTTIRTLTRTKDGGTSHHEWNVKTTTATEGGEDSEIQYDSLARPIRWWTHGTQTGHDPPLRVMQEVIYDELGEHIARRSVPGSEAEAKESRLYDYYTYDATGRILEHTTPWHAATTVEYDGRLVTTKDPFDVATVAESDTLGRLVEVTDAEMGVTSYTYGPFGALWTVTDPGNAVTTTLRDAHGRVRTSVDPDRGKMILVYDGFGDLTSSLDAAGRTTNLFYDDLGRKTRREDKASPNSPLEVTTWTWDTALLGASGQLAKGALAGVEAPGGTASVYTYDKLGRLDTTARAIGDEVFSTSTAYDRFGRVQTITYPADTSVAPFAVKNEYDPYGHLIKVWDPSNGSHGEVFYWQLTGTDGADRTTAETFGNGFTTTRSYFEDKDRLKTVQTRKGDAWPVQSLEYDYNSKLNLSSRRDVLQPVNHLESFQYDALNRLTCASFDDMPPCPKEDSFTYESNGNLHTKPGIIGVYSHDSNHPHAVVKAGADSFAYDVVGNQISRSGATVAYTAFDLPRSITPALGSGGVPVAFDYDGAQQRVRKTAGDEVTVYAGDLYERTTNTKTGAIEHRYSIYGNERVVAVVTRSPAPAAQDKTRYLHVDHLGSIETVTDETGSAAVEKRSYDAFGARRNPAWGAAPQTTFSSATSFGFTGHEDDSDLGLVNMKGRLYDPKVGRFLTTDPFVTHPTFGQSWNPYSYVLNNPLTFTDPSGFETTDTTYSNGVHEIIFDPDPLFGRVPIGPPPPPAIPPPPEPPPNVDDYENGAARSPIDTRATGQTNPSMPQPLADGWGDGTRGGLDLTLSTAGGGADSGERVQAQLTQADYDGFDRNLKEQEHQYALMAVLAPVRFPVVVGIIAFGLLSPDPAYAPTFDTVPEDRPSNAERAVEIAVPVVIGAIGVKVGSSIHGNSRLSDKEQHLYEILRTDTAGKTEVYKYGVSDQGLTAAGLSVRAEKQVRDLTRRAAGQYTYESSVVQVIPSGQGARDKALALEKNLVYQYRDIDGFKPTGNKFP